MTFISTKIFQYGSYLTFRNGHTGGSCLSQIFWEHENQSGLLVIQLIYIKLYRKKETKFWKKIWAKQESSLTTVQLKWDPPVQWETILQWAVNHTH